MCIYGIQVMWASILCVYVCVLQEAQVYAEENSLLFMETSAKTAMNVNDIFMAIAKKLPKSTPSQPRTGTGSREPYVRDSEQRQHGVGHKLTLHMHTPLTQGVSQHHIINRYTIRYFSISLNKLTVFSTSMATSY